MRAQIAFATLLVASLLGSTPMAVAQTGEFPLQVPGSVIHNAWDTQDQLRDSRLAKPVTHTARSHGHSNSLKPTNGPKGER